MLFCQRIIIRYQNFKPQFNSFSKLFTPNSFFYLYLIMISGLLNQKIDIVQFNDTDDGAGSSYPVESVYWSTSAKVDIMKSSRNLQANQETLKPAMMFTVRFRDDKFVNVDMQVKYRGEYFTIQSAEPDYIYKEKLVIIARAVQLPVR